MTNYPDNMSSYDWDHVYGRRMRGEDEEPEREPTVEEQQTELRRLSALRRARKEAHGPA